MTLDKKELMKELNEFFGLSMQWDKLSKADLQSLYDTLVDDDKVRVIFGLDQLQQAPAAAAAQSPMLGGLLDGTAVDGLASNMGQGVKGMVDEVLERQPLRKAIRDRFLGGGQG